MTERVRALLRSVEPWQASVAALILLAVALVFAENSLGYFAGFLVVAALYGLLYHVIPSESETADDTNRVTRASTGTDGR